MAKKEDEVLGTVGELFGEEEEPTDWTRQKIKEFTKAQLTPRPPEYFAPLFTKDYWAEIAYKLPQQTLEFLSGMLGAIGIPTEAKRQMQTEMEVIAQKEKPEIKEIIKTGMHAPVAFATFIPKTTAEFVKDPVGKLHENPFDVIMLASIFLGKPLHKTKTKLEAGTLLGRDVKSLFKQVPPKKLTPELSKAIDKIPDDVKIEYLPPEGAMPHAGVPVSPEALARLRTVETYIYDSRTKKTRPLIGVEAIDVQPGLTQVKFTRNKQTGKVQIQDVGEKATFRLEQLEAPGVKPPEVKGKTPIYRPALDMADPVVRKVEVGIARLPQKDRVAIREVQKMYADTRDVIHQREKITVGKIMDYVSSKTVDVTGRWQRRLIRESGDLGREAAMNLDLARGAPRRTKMIIDEWETRIYKDLTSQQEILLNETIQSRGGIISPIRAGKRLAQPRGIKAGDHLKYMEMMPKEIHQRADVFFSSMRKSLEMLRDNGIITKEAFEKMSVRKNYSPRWWLDKIDPAPLDRVRRAQKISVQDSGLRRLKSGDITLLEQNSRLFLREAWGRAIARIMRNEANKSLVELARVIPDNGLVKFPTKAGTPEYGWTELYALEQGRPTRFWVQKDMAQKWLISEPMINSTAANLVGWMTGTKILKPLATGINPAFALTNLPRDLALSWFTTGDYSSFLPVAGAQMMRNLAITARDAFGRRGRFKGFVERGGGLEFLTKQGQFKQAVGKLQKVQEKLGYIGETSEIWTRLALEEQAIRAGKTLKEATWVARNYLDFAKGGSFIKMLDSGIPYLNASIQATRGIFRAFRDTPKVAIWKTAQLGALAMGLYFANRYIDPESWNSLPQDAKRRYWHIYTPLKYKDKDGNVRRLYAKIAKDQGQRIITSIFESLAAKTVGDPVDVDYITAAAKDAIPLLPDTALPPTLEGLLGYASNKDFWHNEDIWRGPPVKPGQEWTFRTSPIFKQVGKLGLSPERTQYAIQQVFTKSNFYTDLASYGLHALFGQLDEQMQERTTEQMILDLPGIDRVFSSTTPYDFLQTKIEKTTIEEATKRYGVTREFDQLVKEHLRIKKETGQADIETLTSIQQFLQGQEPLEIERLLRRWQDAEKIHDLKYRPLWKQLLGMTPEARAKVFYYWWHSSNAQQKGELQGEMMKLMRTGFFTDRFWLEYNKLRREE